jgi:hypothetical protein
MDIYLFFLEKKGPSNIKRNNRLSLFDHNEMTDSSSPCTVNKYYLRHILYYKISSNSKNNYTKLPSILQYKLLAALCTLTTLVTYQTEVLQNPANL